MTGNEAKRARDEYMSAPSGDLSTQINATLALFTLIDGLHQRIAHLEAQHANLAYTVSNVFTADEVQS